MVFKTFIRVMRILCQRKTNLLKYSNLPPVYY